jgi:hypothetical protein
VEIGAGRSRLVVPASVDDLAEIYEAEPGATLVSGATDVGLWVTKFMRDIGPMIFVGDLPELHVHLFDWSDQRPRDRIAEDESQSDASDCESNDHPTSSERRSLADLDARHHIRFGLVHEFIRETLKAIRQRACLGEL